MKITRTSLISVTSLLVGGFIGASALIALADSTWTSAPSCSTMPCNNTPAPLNVGASKQTKSGWLALTSGLITGGLQILNGSALTGGANGAVLTSDANGNATWTTLPNTSSPLLTNIGTVTWTETINQTGSYFGCGPVTGSATCTSGVGANPYPLPGWNWNTGAISCPSGYAMLTINTSDSYTNLGGTSLQETIGKKGYCVAFQ